MSKENRRNQRPNDTGKRAWEEARRAEDEVGKLGPYIQAGRKMLMDENDWLLERERIIADGVVCQHYKQGRCYDGRPCWGIKDEAYNPAKAQHCRDFCYTKDDGTVRTGLQIKVDHEPANVKREAAARLVAKISVAEEALAKLMDEAGID